MHLMLRLPHLPALLLAAAAAGAGAESPMPDPIAPAVVGRPVEQIAPARPQRAKKPKQAAQAATASTSVAAQPAAAIATAAAPQVAPSPHGAKQALDDRADPGAQVTDNVGQGTHVARKPLGPGAYLGSKYQAVVRKYYDAHPASSRAAQWKIGESVPRGASVTGVPDELRAALPRVPPGHQYVQVDGEVVLLAVQSRMVVDGVSRGTR